jgi:CRP/FNR family cyclic AMP-dependent transcriptional regulator
MCRSCRVAARRHCSRDTELVDGDDRIAGLARSYLFTGVPIEQLSPLAGVATTRRLDRGEVLVRVGDWADELYVVLAGEVKDTVVDEDGNEVVHFLHGPGMTLGEPGFFAADHRRIVEVVATAPTVVIRLDRRDLVPFMVQHPWVKDRVLEKLASNQRWQTSLISSLARKPLPDRLILRLLELVDSNATREDGLAVTPKVSQATLAAMVGVSRENLNRAMAALVAGGLIRQEKGCYVLLDEMRLRRQVVQGVGPMAQRRDRRRDADTARPPETRD